MLVGSKKAQTLCYYTFVKLSGIRTLLEYIPTFVMNYMYAVQTCALLCLSCSRCALICSVCCSCSWVYSCSTSRCLCSSLFPPASTRSHSALRLCSRWSSHPGLSAVVASCPDSDPRYGSERGGASLCSSVPPSASGQGTSVGTSETVGLNQRRPEEEMLRRSE